MPTLCFASIHEGCSASDLRSVSFTAEQLKDAGCSCRQLRDAGFSVFELREASFNLADLDAAGYGYEELKSMFGREELVQVYGLKVYSVLRAAHFTAIASLLYALFSIP